jgi:monoterpene epsilon-lactone hydrolase
MIVMVDPARHQSVTRFGALPPRRSGQAAPPNLLQRRVASEQMGGQPLEVSVEIRSRVIAGVLCRVCTPVDPQGVIVDLHGGGYRLGSALAWTPFGSRLAAASGAQVIVPDYGLAPERPFPNALHDALGVLAAVCDTSAPDRVALMGDSAGGGLAMACTLSAAKEKLDIAGAILLSPWLNLTNTAETFQSRAATDQRFSLEAATEASQAYLQGWSPTDPMASPLFGDFHAVPPTLLLVSSAEVLLQDSLDLAARLAKAGRSIDLHVFPGEPHVWPVLQPDTPAARRALSVVAEFTRRIFAPKPEGLESSEG